MDDIQIIVLSDAHANISAYNASLKMARKLGFDQLLNLGDLLTYGCNPKEILDETFNSIESDKMILIKGNHDQLYFDLIRGDPRYYNTLPEWIQESIDWTTDNTYLENFETSLPWREHYKLDNMYFAHANPFNYGDWTYLNMQDNYIRAAIAMTKHKKILGFFGHTHRQKIINVSNVSKCHEATGVDHFTSDFISKQLAILITLDSIGQPRNNNKRSTILIINKKSRRLNLKFVEVPYDVGVHKKTIRQTLLSNRTKEKLISLF
ncbi:MAG: metallophosphoesterase [Bacteroidetes bacterium]|nr:metallophosphoesterase [Bacteroidota bacterium]